MDDKELREGLKKSMSEPSSRKYMKERMAPENPYRNKPRNAEEKKKWDDYNDKYDVDERRRQKALEDHRG